MVSIIAAVALAVSVQSGAASKPQRDTRTVLERISALPERHSVGSDAAWNAELDRLRKMPNAWPPLTEALSSSDRRLAYRAETLLVRLGYGADMNAQPTGQKVNLSSVLPILLRQLDNPRPDVQVRAYGGPDYMLRMSAQRALIKIAGPGSIPSTPPPGGIELLPGWSHRERQGIDTLVGTIWRADGLEIGYDIGFLAGHHAINTDRPLLWTKKQIVHGYPVQITLRPNRFLEILFFDDSANFSAQPKTEQDVTEVLLIVLSYNPSLISSDIGGVYSNVTEPGPPAGLELEVRLGVRRGGYYAMVHLWGPGAPDLPSVVPVEFVKERIVFTVIVDGKPQRFSGELKLTELVGSLGDRPVVLRRQGGPTR